MELVPVECKGLVILYSMISHITQFPDCAVWLKADQQEEHEFIECRFVACISGDFHSSHNHLVSGSRKEDYEHTQTSYTGDTS